MSVETLACASCSIAADAVEYCDIVLSCEYASMLSMHDFTTCMCRNDGNNILGSGSMPVVELFMLLLRCYMMWMHTCMYVCALYVACIQNIIITCSSSRKQPSNNPGHAQSTAKNNNNTPEQYSAQKTPVVLDKLIYKLKAIRVQSRFIMRIIPSNDPARLARVLNDKQRTIGYTALRKYCSYMHIIPHYPTNVDHQSIQQH